jgi:DNA repair exonuclease SbcCD ATPase subunit
VVWIAVASVVLRVVFAAVLLLLVTWCGWLVVGVWAGRQTGLSEGGASWRAMVPTMRWRLMRTAPGADPPRAEQMTTAQTPDTLTHEADELERRERELTEREAAFADVRGSVNAVIADLLRGQERLHADAELLQRELARQTDAMNAVVAKLADAEIRLQERESSNAERPIAAPARPDPGEPEPAPLDRPPDLDLRAARLELEADLRIEKIEEREQMLRELEEQLRRREHQLANFVAQTQSQLHEPEPSRTRPSAILQ